MHHEKILNGAEFLHGCIHLIRGHLAHVVADVIHLLFHFKEKVKSGCQYFTYSHAFLKHGMLVKITDTDVFGPFDFAFVRHQCACNNTHKSGLTFTVGADKSNMFSRQHPERDILKDGSVSESVG